MASCWEAFEAQVSRIERDELIGVAKIQRGARWDGIAFSKPVSRVRHDNLLESPNTELPPDQGAAGKVGPYRVMLRLVVNVIFSLLLAILLLGSGASAQNDATEPHKAQVSVYVFFSTSCPHCARGARLSHAALRA